ncbi:hypothetical protein N0V90_007553 [Kalmusia sp. IMI 367209]|nr:hypothetical protein N0V90_007553 [Kalmusia sp. IMI 367209]
MQFFDFFSIFTLAAIVVASPAAMPFDPEAGHVQQVAHKIARAPVPIPTLAHVDTATLLKRDDNMEVEDYTFGGFHAKKSGDIIKMHAPFNKTSGSSWCNALEDYDGNKITSAHVDSHKGWRNPTMPKEYVCFFYESNENCDPGNGKAEYVESDPENRAEDTEFADDLSYIHWGCQWHPDNKKSSGGSGWP